jgi:SNF2 family DNA or RNA helicase
MDLKEFLGEFGDSLREKINLSPIFDPENLDEWDRQALGRIEPIFGRRKRFQSQVNSILALAKGFYREGKKAEILVGEMGTGKTFCSIGVASLAPRKNHRTIIMCPGHLVDKWMREIRETLPQAKIVNLNNPGLKELFALKGAKPKGREFYVIGKERAKMHYSWRPAVELRQKTPCCPQCGKALDEKLQACLYTRQVKCPECDSPLWQADRNRSRRYAKAEFIKRYLPKGTFDLFTSDEVHEYKGGDTAQGQALACLAASARRTLALTGTLLGGYSTGLFYLLWRMFPELIKDKAPYRAEKTFAAQYGVLEITQKTPLRDNATSIGGQKAKEIVKEKPGVSPLLLSDFLLENTVFMRLRDISSKLPPYVEEVVGVQMLPDQAEAYKDLESDLRQACSKALACGDRSLLGALVNSLLAYPDGCRRGEEVIHPHTRQFIAGADAIEAGLLPKEEKLLELVQTEVSQGRKCLVCLEHTGTRDLIPTLAERLERVGINPLILRANKPPVAQREGWIRNLVGMHDVMLCNPNLIKTGLDLIEFPTLIFFQTGYSVYTLRQASRRSWRIGQTYPVKVYYLSYLDTMQEKALSLMASKMETALAVEGDLSDKGLVVLAQSGSSMVIELARTLLNQQEAPSLEETWQAYQQESLRADAIMGDAQPVETETVTQTTTRISQGDQQATLKVTRLVRGKVYPKGKVGIGYVGPRQIIFQDGKILYKDRTVGEYDRKGNGQINGKPIKLEKKGKFFLIVELKRAA